VPAEDATVRVDGVGGAGVEGEDASVTSSGVHVHADEGDVALTDDSIEAGVLSLPAMESLALGGEEVVRRDSECLEGHPIQDEGNTGLTQSGGGLGRELGELDGEVLGRSARGRRARTSQEP